MRNTAIHTFWYNPNNDNTMPQQDAACISTWLHQDREVILWTYGHIKNQLLHELEKTFKNFSILEANDVIPKSEYFVADYSHIGAHGYAMFSDVMRYKLLDKFGGWWLDTDMILLSDYGCHLADVELVCASSSKPLTFTERYSTSAGRLMQNNAAIFAAQPGLMNETYERAMKAVEDTVKAAKEGNPERIKWGNTGPILLTDMVEEDKYHVGSVADFYLIDFYAYTGSLSRYAHTETTGSDVVRFFSKSPVGIHMWNSYLHKSGKLHSKSMISIMLEIGKRGEPVTVANVIDMMSENATGSFIDVTDPNHQK